MNRYYFDLLDRGELTADDAGQEFVDLAAAVDEARLAFVDIDISPTLDLAIHIRLNGLVLAVVRPAD